ncbi:MAG: peptide-methionine (S)-S-oxide reductase MsrA [Candidatus Micrarchaeota archaeon]|nr:peptide-methionine (S)-S-oxide reductase MsrA [Candidatus Micrarchaeota archaeon]MDE1824506.1 peptide-methionine (S)-S-oxide reductase MsrA [Candidatus Micrarchaeota archaeon]MDE1850129.1 peptide-methionine (S)-S-oxide reductase MsrA [Candidatus Micrarchaeota archaeon]
MAGKTEKIVFGGGCFWCTEAVFSMFKGVVATVPGYAGGNSKNPTYEEVCTGTTGHAEVLEIEYDPGVAPLEKLLDIFITMHDPTSMNRQGADVGSQYRSIILYMNDEQKKTAQEFLASHQKDFGKPIVTEIKKLDQFYPAEGYHKKYYDKNKLNPYCMLVIGPKVDKVKKKFRLR